MPHFDTNGADTYICQKCARIFNSVKYPPTWRPDITGHKSAGNVCPACLNDANTKGDSQMATTTAKPKLKLCRLTLPRSCRPQFSRASSRLVVLLS